MELGRKRRIALATIVAGDKANSARLILTDVTRALTRAARSSQGQETALHIAAVPAERMHLLPIPQGVRDGAKV
jgi:hypothetical protein